MEYVVVMGVLSKKKNPRMNLKRFRQICSKLIDKNLYFQIEEQKLDRYLTKVSLIFNSKDVYTHKKKRKFNGNSRRSS